MFSRPFFKNLRISQVKTIPEAKAYAKRLYELMPTNSGEVTKLLQQQNQQGWTIGDFIACDSTDPEAVKTYLELLNQLITPRSAEVIKLLQQQNQAGSTIGHLIAQNQTDPGVVKTYLALLDQLSTDNPAEVIKLLQQQIQAGWTIGHIIARYQTDPGVIKTYLELLNKLVSTHSAEVIKLLQQQNQAGWTIGDFIAYDPTDPGVVKTYLELLNQLITPHSAEVIKLLQQQNPADSTIGHLIARHRTDPGVIKTYLELLNKLVSPHSAEVIKLLQQQNQAGWTIGHLIVQHQTYPEVVKTYLELLNAQHQTDPEVSIAYLTFCETLWDKKKYWIIDRFSDQLLHRITMNAHRFKILVREKEWRIIEKLSGQQFEDIILSFSDNEKDKTTIFQSLFKRRKWLIINKLPINQFPMINLNAQISSAKHGDKTIFQALLLEKQLTILDKLSNEQYQKIDLKITFKSEDDDQSELLSQETLPLVTKILVVNMPYVEEKSSFDSLVDFDPFVALNPSALMQCLSSFYRQDQDQETEHFNNFLFCYRKTWEDSNYSQQHADEIKIFTYLFSLREYADKLTEYAKNFSMTEEHLNQNEMIKEEIKALPKNAEKFWAIEFSRELPHLKDESNHLMHSIIESIISIVKKVGRNFDDLCDNLKEGLFSLLGDYVGFARDSLADVNLEIIMNVYKMTLFSNGFRPYIIGQIQDIVQKGTELDRRSAAQASLVTDGLFRENYDKKRKRAESDDEDGHIIYSFEKS